MNTKTIKLLCDQIQNAKNELKELEEEIKFLDLRDHNAQISIVFDYGKTKVSLPVTEFGGQNYTNKVIRGREMILLGAKLAFNKLIDDKKNLIKDLNDLIKVEIESKED
jgi:nitrate reductase assembly molybdenum cofactor insertion protein NarJ